MRWRRAADERARSSGARVAALGTSPLPGMPKLTPSPRYQAMIERFGLTAVEQLTCGCHVHVGVADDEEGVAVLDRIRIWLPVLLALSANSPYWQGRDTGYASFRSQAWTRFPTAGPTEIFGSAAAYRTRTEALVASGVAARSRHDLLRRSAVAEVSDGGDPGGRRLPVRRGHRGRRRPGPGPGRDGEPGGSRRPAATAGADRADPAGDLAGRQLGPGRRSAGSVRGLPRPAAEVLAALVDHVRPALRDSGDEDLVVAGLARIVRAASAHPPSADSPNIIESGRPDPSGSGDHARRRMEQIRPCEQVQQRAGHRKESRYMARVSGDRCLRLRRLPPVQRPGRGRPRRAGDDPASGRLLRRRHSGGGRRVRSGQSARPRCRASRRPTTWCTPWTTTTSWRRTPTAARAFSAAAAENGLERIIYLGGLGRDDHEPVRAPALAAGGRGAARRRTGCR